MLSLLIETSTEQAMIAIVKEGKLLFLGQLPIGHQSSKHLIPQIESGIKSLKIKIKDFDFIGVGVGPGSYTGIRIGVMTAKTLAFATERPLIALCTLHTFVPKNEGPFSVLIDAKISGVYAIEGNKSHEEINYLCEPQVIDISHLRSLLHKAYRIVTPDSTRIKPKIEAIYPDVKLEWETKPPDPLHMYKMASLHYARKEYSLGEQIDIMYLRKTQAEMEWEEKNRPNCNS
jgi:tRNA threonylcarbamoyladenosine biosynthesis protein TsaB